MTAEHEGVAYFLHASWLLLRLEPRPAAESSGTLHDRFVDSSQQNDAAVDSQASAAQPDGVPNRPVDSSDQNSAAEGIHCSAADAGACSNLQAQAQKDPRFIVFGEAAAGGKDTVVRWASASEQQV